MDRVQIREIEKAEYPVLEDFLYNAIYIPEGEEWPSREIIFEPEIYIYVKDFGLDTDCGVVAERDGKIVGAAWTRIIPAYGHLDENTPELAISVLPGYRGQSVGTMLMNHLFELLRERGYKRTSLSVQQNNLAVRFYERLGYKITDEKLDHAGHEDYIMVKELNEAPLIRRYTREDEAEFFALIEREGEEWTYWQGGNRVKYIKALDSCIVYLLFEGDVLCGYARCRDDGGFGVYVLDLLVDKAYRGNEYGRLLMEQACHDYPNDTVYVAGDVYPYYEKLGYEIEGKIYKVKPKNRTSGYIPLPRRGRNH